MKSLYIDMMEKIVGAYSTEDIENYISEVTENGITEHGFGRLTASIGILLAHGKCLHLQELFIQMMDICCKDIPTTRERFPDNPTDPSSQENFTRVGNDFSVRELICCLLALEESNVFSTEKITYWKRLFQTINPYTCYAVIAKSPSDRVHNWAAFGAASEQARVFAGIGNKSEFVDNQIASQLWSFDENGMYRDPNEPMVYDITTRLQLTTALYFGYDGLYKEKLDKILELGGLNTLFMQSVTGEIPFGGRSNQFLHNEAVLAAMCEYEAVRHYKKGDLKLAGRFKYAAKLAADSIVTYLDSEQLPHVKNYYPKDSFYGCEKYAYYKKYMVTTASFLYLAYLFADDKIMPECSFAKEENYIFETTPYFHKTMCKAGDYFVEYETNADFQYDSNGLGRIHKKGAPSSICLSLPFTKTPKYGVDIENPSDLSICFGIYEEEKFVLSSDPGTKYVLVNKEVTEAAATMEWQVTLNNGFQVSEKCVVSDEGVILSFKRLGEASNKEVIYGMLPAFDTDGVEKSTISMDEQNLEITYKGHKCRYSTTGVMQDTGKVYANRNGHYRLFMAQSNQKLEVHVQME